MQGEPTEFERIKQRLRALPQELCAARAEEYRARREVDELENNLALVKLAVLSGENAPKGGSASEREGRGLFILHANEQWMRAKKMVTNAEDAYFSKKILVRLLEDEFSSLRNLSRLAGAQMMLIASGVQYDTVPVVDRMLDRELLL